MDGHGVSWLRISGNIFLPEKVGQPLGYDNWRAAQLAPGCLGGLMKPKLGGGNSNIFYFHLYLGKWSNLTNIFQMGWNHQPENKEGPAKLQQSLLQHCMISWLQKMSEKSHEKIGSYINCLDIGILNIFFCFHDFINGLWRSIEIFKFWISTIWTIQLLMKKNKPWGGLTFDMFCWVLEANI